MDQRIVIRLFDYSVPKKTLMYGKCLFSLLS